MSRQVESRPFLNEALNGLVDEASSIQRDARLDGGRDDRRAWLKQAAAAVAAPWLLSSQGHAAPARKPSTGLILSYQRFSEKAGEGQTISRATLAAHFKAIKEADANVISMVDLVSHHVGRLANLPPRPIVLTVDDCHRSIADILMKMLHGSAWPVSLFVTPDNVGQGKDALSWDALSGLHHSGRFSVQSRTLSGLDLMKERRNHAPEEFAKFAEAEILRGKETVEQRLVKPVFFHAWPHGAVDKELMAIAEKLEFQASVALGNRPATLADPMQGLPRTVMHERIDGKALKKIIADAFPA